MDLREKLLQKALSAQRESKFIDFKESCDIESAESWCEIIKDIAAMANSGGGVIVFGLKNDGTFSGFDGTQLLSYDTAKITDKIAKYTGRQFSDFELLEVRRGITPLAVLVISEAKLPIVFTKAGTYRTENGKEKVAFQQGAIYFRHGAKSEPGDSEDLREVIDRQVERVRRTWLSGIRKVTQAPEGSVIQVLTPAVASHLSQGKIFSARIVADKTAPGVRPESADSIWPHRAKNVVAMVNQRLEGKGKINSYDLQCVRKMFNIEKEHPEYCYRPFALISPQYSDAFVDWLVTEFRKDDNFFTLTRQRAQTVSSS
jgi:Putative DNA-binding domain/EC042_2821-lke REase